MAIELSYIDVEHFLEALGLENISRATSEEMRFSCPFLGHENGDRNASAYMNTETTAWYCHGCKQKGDAVSFTADVLGISPIDASRMLKERYQPGYFDPDKRSTVEEVKRVFEHREVEEEVQPYVPETAIGDFAVDWHKAASAQEGFPACDYILGRGFMPATLEAWEFGYDRVTDRITFAVRDEANRLIGFKGRAYDERHPKYLVIGDSESKQRYGWRRYYTSRVVFGLPKAIQLIDPHGTDVHRHIIVCEGELNAVALWQMGFPAVAVNGSNFSDHHAKLIKWHADEVTIFFDCDDAGEKGVWGWIDTQGKYHPGIVDKLRPFIPVNIVEAHEDDPAEMMQEGQEDEVSRLIDNSLSVTVADMLRSSLAAQ